MYVQAYVNFNMNYDCHVGFSMQKVLSTFNLSTTKKKL